MGVPFSFLYCFPSRGFRDTVNISSRRYHVGMCDGIAMRGTIRRGERRHALRCVGQYVVGGGVMHCVVGKRLKMCLPDKGKR